MMLRMLFVITVFVVLVSGKPDANHALPNQQSDVNKLGHSSDQPLKNQSPGVEMTNTDDVKTQDDKPDVTNKGQDTDPVDKVAEHELGQYTNKQLLPLTASAGRAVEVAFEAISLTNRQLQGASDVMIFDNVQFDVGDVYDPVTSEFTVPVDGIYMVHWAVRAQSSYMWFNLINSGQVISEMVINNYYSSSYTSVGGISDSRLLSLTTGDVLYVIGCGKDSTGQCAGEAWTNCDNYNCAFGAVLLYPLAG